MTENPVTIEVKEKDKPFILALSSVGLFAGELIAAVFMAITHPEADISTLKEAMTFTMGLVSTAWSYYLIKKGSKNGNAS